ncbi:hypothetical protein GGR50DRAFT_698467 [Xylaria sp. CBS 124048]|nr:hypothetical protein GGR50DRAFT_698467 [Xylaria sp. CBS 124048]
MAFSHAPEDAQRTLVKIRHQASIVSDSKMTQLPPRSCQTPTCTGDIYNRPHYSRPTLNSLARTRPPKSRLPSDSSPSSRSTFRHSSGSDVPATDPEHITRLWQSVMAYDGDTNMPKIRRAQTPSPPKAGISTPAASARRLQPQPTAGIHDSDFETSALAAWGVSIQEPNTAETAAAAAAAAAVASSYEHFGLSGMPKDRVARYYVYSQRFPLGIWIKPDTEREVRIRDEYLAMGMYGCNEAEYSTFALHEIFLNSRLSPPPPTPVGADTSKRPWTPVRMLRLAQGLSPDTWESPPYIARIARIAPPEKQYEWDIRPDCAYYISLQAFPTTYRDKVDKFVSVVQKRAFAPYLTIEFKKENETAATTRNHLAAASAMALYNRWRLKSAALHHLLKNKGTWPEEQKLQMRHYGITLVGPTWQLWYTTPKTYHKWTGCTMSHIIDGQCTDLDGVIRLLDSINDVHYWGLTEHANCKTDIDLVLIQEHK